MIAEVIINSIAKELNKIFDYIVPKNIEKDIKVGARVFVPFGGKKVEEGFVIGLKDKSEFANKEIIEIEDSVLTKENIELAKLMAKRYFCNISECIRLMLPPGNTTKVLENRVKDKEGRFVYLKDDIENIKSDLEDGVIKSEKQKRVLEFLISGNEGINILDLQAIADVSIAIINTLVKNEYLEIVKEVVERNPFIHKEIKKDKPLKLTKEQEKAFNEISKSKYDEFLLYGITGSRKNRDIFTINTKCIRKRKNSNCTCTRDFTYTSNGR